MAKKRNFNTLTILYIHIPLKTIKILPKNVGYAQEYPGTTVGPPMGMSTSKYTCEEEDSVDQSQEIGSSQGLKARAQALGDRRVEDERQHREKDIAATRFQVGLTV